MAWILIQYEWLLTGLLTKRDLKHSPKCVSKNQINTEIEWLMYNGVHYIIHSG